MNAPGRYCTRCGAGYPAGTELCERCAIPLLDDAPDEDVAIVGDHGHAADHDHGDDEVVHDPFGVIANEHTVYDVSAWTDELSFAVEQALTTAGIAFAWDEDGLAIPTDRETEAEQIMDQLEESVGLVDTDEGPDADDGEAAELMGELFLAAGRLAKDPTHTIARHEFVTVAEEARDTGPPFGFNPEWWEQVQLACALIRRDVLDESDPHDVTRRAQELRDALRPYV